MTRKRPVATSANGSRRRRLAPSAWFGAILAVLLVFVLRGTVSAQSDCTSGATGRDFHGATLTGVNFAHQNLRNANFRCATLIGANFTRADLTGADFTNAVFTQAAGTPAIVDFNFANLTGAQFVGAQFKTPTYFTYATLTAVVFSNTDISNGFAIFGDESLVFDGVNAVRPSFRSTVMNCEFVSQWHLLDLTRARIAHCLPQLAGAPRDFSHAMLGGVDLSGQVLDGWKFKHADLVETNFNGVSLQRADLRNAQLQGAQLNNANLAGATLAGAALSNDTTGNVANAAALKNAHLRDVNLQGAQLAGVDFTYANLYSSRATADVGCKVNGDGFTVDCASVNGAQMDGTSFDGAYLFGLDLTDVTATGVSFKGAMLAGADFSGSTFSTSTLTGKNTSFLRAYLQGANLRAAQLQCSGINCFDLTDAFVDFMPRGNGLYVQLSGVNHNNFAGCPTTPGSGKPVCRQDVCLKVSWQHPTTLPVETNTFTCPDHSVGPCGRPLADGSNRQWGSQLDINNPGADAGPPGWYGMDASYSKASPPQVVCDGRGEAAVVSDW